MAASKCGDVNALSPQQWLYSSGFVEMHEVPDHRLRERHLQDAVDVKHGLTRQPARAVKTTDL